MTAHEFHNWLKKAKRGARTIYHTGLLMADRDRHIDWQNHAAVDAVGKAAYAAYQEGKVVLTQQRTKIGSIYFATRV